MPEISREKRPGNYEVAKASDKIHRSAPVATFMSNKPRFKEISTVDGPGPGTVLHKALIPTGDYTHVSDDKFRSFHLNLQSLWI